MKIYINGILGAFILTIASTASAQIAGLPVTFGCKPDQVKNALTIACAELEVSDNGCPSSYTVDGLYCVAKDPNAEHQTVVRNTCPLGMKFDGPKCKRVEEGSKDT